MTIYEKNREILQKKYPAVLKAIDEGKADQETIGIGTALVEERKVLYAIKEESQFQLDSLYDSDSLMEMWFQTLGDVSYQARFVWFGFGNGMYVRTILKHVDDSAEIIVYEPSLSVIAASMQDFTFEDTLQNPHVHLVVPGFTEAYEDVLFRYLDYANKAYLHYGRYLNYDVLFISEQDDYTNGLQFVLNSINSTRSVYVRFGEAYFENYLSNFPYLLKGRTIEQLYYVIPKDIPAIIVSAGPSLDKNIQELRNAKNKALIIAVDSAIRPMLQADILPDLFISVDGKKMPTHFTDERVKNIPMVCCIHGNKDPMGMHTGLKIFFDDEDENDIIKEFFHKKGREFAGLSSGGSVANDAFSLADTLRLQTIILVGQDLAYTNHMTHSAGTIHGVAGDAQVSINAETVMVDGYYGGKIESSHEFEFYRKWFEGMIVEKPYLKVINATEGGSDIKGTEKISLKNAISRECKKEVDISSILQSIPPFFNEEEQKEFWLFTEKKVDDIQEMKKQILLGIRDYEKMKDLVYSGKYRGSEMKKLSEKTGRLRETLEQDSCMSLIEYQIQSETTAVLEMVYEKADSEREELLQAITLGSEYLQAVVRAIDQTIPVLKKKLCDQSSDDTMKQSQVMAKIQGLLGEMQLNAKKAGKYWDE